MNNMTDTVKQLLIINVLFFIGSYLVPQANELLSLHYFESDGFKFWQPITHIFMHGGPMHIFFNMFALVSFGSALEQMWGAKKFLFFYFSCGIGAALAHSGVNYYHFHDGLNVLLSHNVDKGQIIELLNQGKYDTTWLEFISQSELEKMYSSYLTPAVGASGAIYGLLVAFAFMFPNAELMMMFIPVPVKAKYFVPVIVLLDLFSGVTGISLFGGGNIAHFAHVGGALIGFVMMWYWKKNQFNQNRWDR
ncbi:MAG: rhomboid family intramembrane serine protease [Flavobacteria bacterium GWF1_32_7]|nr:MAG: rhomboid family intramembrane serine protease [Flavobacteria bacterium GWF1_32_7]